MGSVTRKTGSSLLKGRLMKNNYLLAFLSGVMFSLSWLSLMQDSFGKDGYIAYVETHWVSGSITIPLAAFLLIGSISIQLYLIRKGR